MSAKRKLNDGPRTAEGSKQKRVKSSDDEKQSGTRYTNFAQNATMQERKSVKKGKLAELDEEVAHFVRLCYKNFAQTKLPINMPIICDYAKGVAASKGIIDFKASNGWFCNFVERYGFKKTLLHGEAADASIEAHAAQLEELREEMLRYSLDHIFNMAETGTSGTT